jgi:hypothetical protein
MRAVFLAVPGHAFEEFLAFFKRIDADAEDLHLTRQISLPFVNEGRHLDPAPGSRPTSVEEDDGCRGLRERGGKINRSAIDILQIRRGKFITGFDLGHATDREKGRGCPWGSVLSL